MRAARPWAASAPRNAAIAVLTILGSLLPGCGTLRIPQIDFTNSQAVAAATTREFDSYEQVTQVVTPTYQIGTDVFEDMAFVMIRAVIRGGTTITQVYVLQSYFGDWRFYDRAAAIDGTRFELTPIDRDVKCTTSPCHFTESLAINIDPSELARYAGAGLALSIRGKGGSFNFVVPGPMIQGFLMAMAE